MPTKTAVINYQKCKPGNCKDGLCAAVLVCERKVIKQEAPYEKPDPPMLCVGCAACVAACQNKAIILI